MKLLNCLVCHDIVSIRLTHARKCECGKCEAIYLADKITVKFSGPARILGIREDSYDDSLDSKDYARNYQWFVIDPMYRSVRNGRGNDNGKDE